MALAFTLPAVAIGALAVKSFGDFDKAMVESTAIMGDVSDTMKGEMADAARQLSKTVTFSSKEIAESYFFLASAGLDANQALKAQPVVARFAQAGAFDLSMATSLLAGSQAALGLKVADTTKNMENMLRISDVLVKANRLADATTEQFATALTRAGGTMKAFGIDLEQGVAVMAALAEIQRKGEAGGESFARALRLMIPAANSNADAYAKLGVRVFEADQSLRNFADILLDMEGAFAGMKAGQISAALETLGFQRRMQGAILPLVGMSEGIRKYEASLRDAAGTTKDVSDKQLKAFWNALKLIRNMAEVAAQRVGEVLAPTILRFGAALGRAAGFIEKMDDKTLKWVVGIVAVVAAIGPVLMVVGALITGLGGLVAMIPLLLTLAVPFLALASASIAVVGAITAIGAGLVNVIGEGDTFAERWGDVMGRVKDFFFGTSQTITEGLLEWVQAARTAWGLIGLTAREWFGKMQLRGTLFFENLIIDIINVKRFFGALFPWLGKNWSDMMTNLADAAGVAIMNIADNFKNLGQSLLEFIKSPLKKGFQFEFTNLLAGFKPEKLTPFVVDTVPYEDISLRVAQFVNEIDAERKKLLDPTVEIDAVNKTADAAEAAAKKTAAGAHAIADGNTAMLESVTGANFAAAIEAGTADASRVIAAAQLVGAPQEAGQPTVQSVRMPTPTSVAQRFGSRTNVGDEGGMSLKEMLQQTKRQTKELIKLLTAQSETNSLLREQGVPEIVVI